jgi:hypothetical protein
LQLVVVYEVGVQVTNERHNRLVNIHVLAKKLRIGK